MLLVFFFFFQAEDGIRDLTVTGVQTCALPISCSSPTPGPKRQRPHPRRYLQREHDQLSTACSTADAFEIYAPPDARREWWFAEVVLVEVAAPLAGNSSRLFGLGGWRSIASSAIACSGTARRLGVARRR